MCLARFLVPATIAVSVLQDFVPASIIASAIWFLVPASIAVSVLLLPSFPFLFLRLSMREQALHRAVRPSTLL
jgi:hypothetical protein